MNQGLLNRINSRLSEMEFGEISVQTILILLLLSLMITGTFFIIKKYVFHYFSIGKARRKARFNLFRLEVLVWSVFAFFAIYNLLSESLWISGFIIVIIGLVGFKYWMDLFMGLIFRLEDNFKKGESVKYLEHTGIIYNIGKRNLQLKTEDEELVFIPYSKISKNLLIKRQAKGKLKSAKIILEYKDESVESFISKIRKLIFECPWAIVNEKPSIIKLDANRVSVTVYGVDPESIDRIEKFLNTNI